MQSTVSSNSAQRHSSKNGVTNLYRIVMILWEEATAKLRTYLATHLPTGMTVEDTLQYNFQMLKRLKETKKIITMKQWKMLFPESSDQVVNINSFDLSLCVLLIRNIAVNEHQINWDRPPGAKDIFIEHDILRLKLLRNRLIHRECSHMTGEEFCREWDRLAVILKRLGTSDTTITTYLHRNLDPEAAERYCNDLREQYVHEMCLGIEREKKSKCYFRCICLFLLAVCVGASVVASILLTRGENSACVDNITLMVSSYGTFKYMPRSGWKARKPKATAAKFEPDYRVPNVVISDTMTPGTCPASASCCRIMKQLQDNNMDKRGWNDIAWNFLIGEDGVVYEGRGWDTQGSLTMGWNPFSYGIAIVGEYRYDQPRCVALQVLKRLIDYGIYKRKIAERYTLYGLCQLRPFPSPGKRLYKEIQTWPQWKYFNDSKLLPPPRKGRYCLEYKDEESGLQCDV